MANKFVTKSRSENSTAIAAGGRFDSSCEINRRKKEKEVGSGAEYSLRIFPVT
jgi:hypothetical protein